MQLEGPGPTLFISVLDWMPEALPVPLSLCDLYSETVMLHAFLVHLIVFSLLLSLIHSLSFFVSFSHSHVCTPDSMSVSVIVHVCV